MAKLISLKLLVDTHKNRVMFAEVGKEFVDFLFDILNLKVATVLNLVQEQDQLSMGCLQNLYESIENLNDTYFEQSTTKDTFFEPFSAGKHGFVNGLATYMVTDDLNVEPISAISILTLLNDFGVKEVGVLKGKIVDVGMNEAMKLLKSSLNSKNVLTQVFLENK